jgi:putative hydrolase of the HAD superfamily
VAAGGVLVDLFGTVVPPFSSSAHRRALDEAAHQLGLDPTRCSAAWEADYPDRIRGRSGDIADQLRRVAATEGTELPPDQLDAVTARYRAVCAGMMEPRPTVLATLQTLRDRSLAVGLVSNTAPDFAEAFERSPLRSLFTTCTYSCEAGVAKPEAAIYRLAAGSLGLDPERLVYVGDGSDDELGGAERTGLLAALVDADASDTYDAVRPSVSGWSGIRLRQFADLLPLIG